MLENRQSGQSSVFTIPLVDYAGDQFSATAGTWSLYDDVGVLITSGNITDLASTSDSAVFTIQASHLTLDNSVSSAGREIVLNLTNGTDATEIRDYFVLVNQRPLIFLQNTILTYPQALAIRQSFGPTIDAWDAATMQQQIAALIHAHANLSRITYAVNWTGTGLVSDYAVFDEFNDNFGGQRKTRLNQLNQSNWSTLPTGFKKALQRAQIVESDVILGGDAVGKTRQDGIVSETIGESSMFYNSKPYLQLPISRRAYDILKPYIRINIRFAR